ncbi:MAG: hypothetical protein ACLQU1_12895 [Bryobacteraceae bacterium]
MIGVSRQAIVAVENGKYEPSLPPGLQDLVQDLVRLWEKRGGGLPMGRRQ